MRLLWKTHFNYTMTRILYICRFGHLGFYHYHCNSQDRINEHWILVQSQKWLLRAFCTSHGWFRSWSLVFVFPQPDSFPARFFSYFNIFYLDFLYDFDVFIRFSSFLLLQWMWMAEICDWLKLLNRLLPSLIGLYCQERKHIYTNLSFVLVQKDSASRDFWKSLNYKTTTTFLSWSAPRWKGWWGKK